MTDQSYHDASSLTVQLVGLRRTLSFQRLTAEEWKALWLLENPRRSEDSLPEPGSRKPQAFSFALLQKVKRPDELTVEDVVRLARGEAGLALDDTATDRKLAGERWLDRQGMREDNRRNGGWGKGRD